MTRSRGETGKQVHYYVGQLLIGFKGLYSDGKERAKKGKRKKSSFARRGEDIFHDKLGQDMDGFVVL